MSGTTEKEDSSRETWLKYRRITTVICTLYCFLFTVEYTAVMVSLLYYIKDVFSNLRSPNMLYSVIMACVVLFSSMFGVIIGRLVDRTQNIKRTMHIVLTICIVGNILYTMHFSIWFLVIGRVLCGSGFCLISSISGEFARIYDDVKDLKTVLVNYQVAYSAGFIFGPAFSTVTNDVKFTLFGVWHIDRDNFIGIFMAVCLTCMQFAVLIGVRNLSKDSIGLNEKIKLENQNELAYLKIKSEKELETKMKNKVAEINAASKLAASKLPTPQRLTLKAIFKDFDVVLLILIGGLLNYNASCNELLFTLIGRDIMTMSLKQFSGIMFVSLTVFILLMWMLWGKCFASSEYLITAVMLCIFLGCYACVLLLIPIFVVLESTILKSLLLVSAIIANSLSGIAVITTIRELLFRLVPKQSASLIDSVRDSFATGVCALTGFLVASMIFETMTYSLPVTILILLLLSIPLYLRSEIIQQRINYND